MRTKKTNLKWMMMKKSIMNLSFKIAAQFLPSNQCGPYLSQENARFFFLFKWRETKSNSEKLMKTNLRWMMMKKSIVNLSFKIAAQFLPSNQCGQLALARHIYLKKMQFLFSFKWRQTKSKSEKLMKTNLRWMMVKKSIVNLSFKIAAQFFPSNQFGRVAQARLKYLKKMADFFFLVKWRQTKSNSKKLMKTNLRWMMMKKSIVNLSFKIAAQFLPSNQCGRVAQARLICLKKMPDYFSRQMTTNKVRVWKIDDDDKINSESFSN